MRKQSGPKPRPRTRTRRSSATRLGAGPGRSLAGDPSRLGRSARAVRAGLRRSFGRMPDGPLSARPGDPGHSGSPGIRDRTTDLPEPARRPGHGQPVPTRPGGAASTRASCRSTATGPGPGWTRTSSPGASAWRSWATWCSAWMPLEPASGRSSPGRHVPRRLVGASLWPVGTPLIGLQVYDNRRAVDYLISRPEVDPSEAGDHRCVRRRKPDVLRRRDRRSAGGRHPGLRHRHLRLLSHDRLLRLRGQCRRGSLCHDRRPAGHDRARALLVISATRDALQFSVGEAAKSVAHARERFRLLGPGRKDPSRRHRIRPRLQQAHA